MRLQLGILAFVEIPLRKNAGEKTYKGSEWRLT